MGRGAFDRLVGMYAFALWDTRTETLLLVRDRLGIKPLYWTRRGGGVIFGSEPKAVLAHPEVPAEVDAEGLAALFTVAIKPRARASTGAWPRYGPAMSYGWTATACVTGAIGS